MWTACFLPALFPTLDYRQFSAASGGVWVGTAGATQALSATPSAFAGEDCSERRTARRLRRGCRASC